MILVYATAKYLSVAYMESLSVDERRPSNAVRHVASQKPDFANFPDGVTYQKIWRQLEIFCLVFLIVKS